MRRIHAVGIALLLVAGSVAAQTTDITFRNDTGVTIYFVYASAASTDTWGEDLLGNRVLEDGASFTARVRGAGPRFDVRAIDADENEYIVWEWDATDARIVRITADAFVGAGASIRSEAALAWLDVVNRTTYRIEELWIAPAGVEDWADGLQELETWESIEHTEEYRLEVDVERFETYEYDIMLIDIDGDRYVKRGVNLEVETETVFSLDDIVWD